MSEDSLELQIAKGEAKYSAMTEQILALLEGLPEEIDVAGMDDDTARRIDELLLKKDIADEQNIAIDTFLRKGSKLTAQQAVLFGDAPENAQFSRFWRSGTKSAIERVLAQNAGKTVLFRPSEGIFVVKSGDTEEKRIAIREA